MADPTPAPIDTPENIPTFPGAVRLWLYRIQYIVTGIMFLMAIGYGAAQNALPQWYTVTAAVLSGLWSYTGLSAATKLRP